MVNHQLTHVPTHGYTFKAPTNGEGPNLDYYECQLGRINNKYRKHATNGAHLTLVFYFLRWVPQFSNFGI